LLVLDRSRGTQLAAYDAARDFVVPIINDMTDRIYLASNDGLFTCLHDRDYSTPLQMKTVAQLQSTAAGAPPKKAPAEAVEMKKPEPPKDKLPKEKPEEKMPEK
jgi:hypothetical protein